MLVAPYVPQWTEVIWNSAEREYTVRVTGSDIDTLIEMPPNLAKGSAAWNAYVDNIALSVESNLDPSSPTYDPDLTNP